jgi:hypothetical protein
VVEGGGTRGMDDSEEGDQIQRQRRYSPRWARRACPGFFLFFCFLNSLTMTGMCKTPASVIPFLETGRATASINQGLTEAFEGRRLGLPASKNKKRPPPKRFFVVVKSSTAT